MTPRERALRCLNYQPADRLCLAGSFRPEVWEKLRAHFPDKDESEIRDTLGIGFSGWAGMNTSPSWMARSVDTPLDRGIPHPDGSVEDERGVRMAQDTSGPYLRYVYHPLADEANLNTYEFPDLDEPGLMDGVAERVAEAKKTYLVIAGTSTFFKNAWELRGLHAWLTDLGLDSAFAPRLLDRLLECKLEYTRRMAQAGVDMFCMAGDIAMQTGPFMRPETWRKHFKWRDAKLIEEARKHGVKYFYFHTDGNLMPAMEDLIEIGFNIFDPIQPECMDPVEVKRKFGDRITLHGTISSQQTLPHGTVDDVRREVEERVRTCGYDNGLVIAPNNVVQYDVPLENLLAVYDTVKEIGPAFYQG